MTANARRVPPLLPLGFPGPPCRLRMLSAERIAALWPPRKAVILIAGGKPMKTLAFMSQKGGTGKTTLAVHLAVAATEGGQAVAIVDTDPQRSATTWGRRRQGQPPTVATVPASE